jgi:hypothetical protein
LKPAYGAMSVGYALAGCIVAVSVVTVVAHFAALFTREANVATAA